MAAMSDLNFGLKIAQKATEHGVDASRAADDGVCDRALRSRHPDRRGLRTSDPEGRFYWPRSIVRREASATCWPTAPIGPPNGSARGWDA
jgi:hypothetical protein